MLQQSGLEKSQQHIQLLKAAIGLREAKEFEQAIGLLEKSLQLMPDYALTHVFLGLTYQELGQPMDAERAFRGALAIEPQSREALQGLGMLLLSQNRLPEAIVYLQKHLDLDPNNSDTLDVLVPALLKDNRIEQADQLLQKAWAETKNEKVAVRYARYLLSTAQVEKASTFLRQAVEIAESPHLLLELALTLVIEEEYTQAIPILQRALKIRPDYDRALRGLAHCYTQLKQPERAIETAEQALAIDPRHYRNWQAKADALLLMDRNEDAADAAQTGIRLIDPGDEEARPVLGVLYVQEFNALLRLNRMDEALQTMAQARKALPGDPRFYEYPIQISAKGGRLSDAVVLARQAIQDAIFKNSEDQLKVLHIIADESVNWYLAGKISESLEAFRDLVVLAPQESRFQMSLGFILTGEGDLPKAEEHLQAALATCEDDIRYIILCDLGYLHLLLGQYEQAEHELAEATPNNDDTALLRIAYWLKGQWIPDYAPHPTRWVPIHAASQANLAALALARGQAARAVELAQEIIAAHPDESLGYEVLGCAQHAGQQVEQAIDAWKQAQQLAKVEQLRSLLETWISGV